MLLAGKVTMVRRIRHRASMRGHSTLQGLGQDTTNVCHTRAAEIARERQGGWYKVWPPTAAPRNIDWLEIAQHPPPHVHT